MSFSVYPEGTVTFKSTIHPVVPGWTQSTVLRVTAECTPSTITATRGKGKLQFKIRSTHPRNFFAKPAAFSLETGAAFEVLLGYKPMSLDEGSGRIENPLIQVVAYPDGGGGEKIGTITLRITTEKEDGEQQVAKGKPSNDDGYHLDPSVVVAVNHANPLMSSSRDSVMSVDVKTCRSSIIPPPGPSGENNASILEVNSMDVDNNRVIDVKGCSSTGGEQQITTPTTDVAFDASIPTTPNPLQSYIAKAAAAHTSTTPIEVYVRVRPMLPFLNEARLSSWAIQGDHIHDEETTYCFDGVILPDVNNIQTFDSLKVFHHLQELTQGINCTIFAYGHTCSGKTHTILGTKQEPGIALLALAHLIQYLDSDSFKEKYPQCEMMTLTGSYFEVYNEIVNDLLVPPSRNSTPLTTGTDLPIRQDSKTGNFFIPGLTSKKITSLEDGIQLLAAGDAVRKVGSSHINDRSSRSHTVFRLTFSMQSESNPGSTIHSELHLVDLAGSETLTNESNKKETTHINLSLSHLKRVITQLSHKEKFISYRNSTLTKVLKQALGGNSKTMIICAITLSETFRRDTKSTLLFGTLAKTITNYISVNESFTYDGLMEENKQLREQIRMMAVALDKQQQQPSQLQQHLLPVTSSGHPPLSIAAQKQRFSAGATDYNSKSGTGDVDESSLIIENLEVQLRDAQTQLQFLSRVTNEQHSNAGMVMQKDTQLVELMARTLVYLQRCGCGVRVTTSMVASSKNSVRKQQPSAGAEVSSGNRQIPLLGPSVSTSSASRLEEAQQTILRLDSGQESMTCFSTDVGFNSKQDKPRPSRKFFIKDIQNIILSKQSSKKQFEPQKENADGDKKNINNNANLHNSTCLTLYFLTGGNCQKGPSFSYPTASATPSSSTVAFQFLNESDFEAWVVCLTQLTKLEPKWDQRMDLDSSTETGQGASSEAIQQLLPEEKSFCSANHIFPSHYLEAKHFVFNTTSCQPCVALVDLRVCTPLNLFEAEILCRFFVSQGWLVYRSLLCRSVDLHRYVAKGIAEEEDQQNANREGETTSET